MIVGFSLACGGAAPEAPVVADDPVATAPSAPAAASWDGKTTFDCSGADKKTLRGVTAQVASGPAITAGGMCELTIEDCDLSAGVGLEVSGMAKVTMVRGSVTGSEYALYLGGESVTKLQGVTVKGETYKAGLAVLEQGAAGAASATTSAPAAAAPAAAPAATPSPAAAAPAKASGTASSATPAPDAGALKKKCDAAFSKCKHSAYDTRNSCSNGCVDSSTNTCNSACESCQSACVSTYNDKTSACERTWNSCY